LRVGADGFNRGLSRSTVLPFLDKFLRHIDCVGCVRAGRLAALAYILLVAMTLLGFRNYLLLPLCLHLLVRALLARLLCRTLEARFEPRHHAGLELQTQVTFDAADTIPFLRRHQRDCDSLLARAAGASTAMHMIVA